MAQRYDELSDTHLQFIAKQKIFFVGTAAAESRVNVSPKGMDSLRVLGPRRVDDQVRARDAGDRGATGRLRRLQTGFVRSYALSMLGGSVLVVASLLAVRFV